MTNIIQESQKKSNSLTLSGKVFAFFAGLSLLNLVAYITTFFALAEYNSLLFKTLLILVLVSYIIYDFSKNLLSGIFQSDAEKLHLSDKPPLTFMGWLFNKITYVILITWAGIVIWPIYQIVQSSFNGAQEQYIIVGGQYDFSLRFFETLFNETLFVSWVKNTLFIAISTAILTVIIVSFTGYAYSRYRFKGRKASLMAIMLIQTIPAFAGITAYFTMYSIIRESVAPFFTGQMMLILIYSAGGIAGNTFILKGYLDSISMELDEAAKIDGCSSIQVYRLIIMPIAKPMLSIIALWSFIGPFMDFMLPRILLAGNTQAYTLAAGLQTLIADIRTMQQPVFAAGGVLTAVPIVIMFALLQRNLISGLAKGAVKG